MRSRTWRRAFDPATSAAYAARFLNELHDQTGDWSKAAGMYHSATPVLGAEYQRKVLAALPEEQQRAGAASQTTIARAWSASLASPLGTPFGAAGGVGGFHPGVRSMTMGGAPVGRSLASYRAMPVRMMSMPRVSFFPRH